jgi:hypothetical protein
MTNKERVEVIDWVHDKILLRCDTIELAISELLWETRRLLQEEENDYNSFGNQ